jgi:hypothetical protein
MQIGMTQACRPHLHQDLVAARFIQADGVDRDAVHAGPVQDSSLGQHRNSSDPRSKTRCDVYPILNS